MQPLISIVIPVYNRPQALSKTLEALMMQTYQNFEIIIIDDGSVEDVTSVATPFLLKHKNVRFIQQPNQGAPSARNRGFGVAVGDFILFLDADVICAPTYLEKSLQTLQLHPEASYVYCSYYFGHKKIIPGVFSASRLRRLNFVPSFALLRRSALSSTTPWDKQLKRFQDWDLWLTLLKDEKIGVFLPEILQNVLPNPSGISSWLPSFAYRFPWKYFPAFRLPVQHYEQARSVVLKKHGLI